MCNTSYNTVLSFIIFALPDFISLNFIFQCSYYVCHFFTCNLILWCFKICLLIKIDYYGCKVKLSTRKVRFMCCNPKKVFNFKE